MHGRALETSDTRGRELPVIVLLLKASFPTHTHTHMDMTDQIVMLHLPKKNLNKMKEMVHALCFISLEKKINK